MIQVVGHDTAIDGERQLSLRYYDGDYRSGIYEYIFRSREQDFWLLTVPEYDPDSARRDITIIGFERITNWRNNRLFDSRPEEINAFLEVINEMLVAINATNSPKRNIFVHFDPDFDLSRVGREPY